MRVIIVVRIVVISFKKKFVKKFNLWKLIYFYLEMEIYVLRIVYKYRYKNIFYS
jgi:hypothetical protein